MAHSFDVAKARTLMFYLGKAGQKIEDRRLAKEKVRVAIKRLKSISTDSVKKDIQELERRIAEALVMEKRIRAVQRDEDAEHNELIDKIDQLQLKLAKYMDSVDSRQERMKDLEMKILKATQPRVYEIVKAKEELMALEKEYQAEKAEGNYKSDELAMIEKQIKSIRGRIKELESAL